VEREGAACLGDYGRGGCWRPWILVLLLAGNKGDLHTYAGRNCLGTEVMEGIYIARVGWRVAVVCRKEKKK
jgi:hypothetical protein